MRSFIRRLLSGPKRKVTHDRAFVRQTFDMGDVRETCVRVTDVDENVRKYACERLLRDLFDGLQETVAKEPRNTVFMIALLDAQERREPWPGTPDEWRLITQRLMVRKVNAATRDMPTSFTLHGFVKRKTVLNRIACWLLDLDDRWSR